MYGYFLGDEPASQNSYAATMPARDEPQLDMAKINELRKRSPLLEELGIAGATGITKPWSMLPMENKPVLPQGKVAYWEQAPEPGRQPGVFAPFIPPDWQWSLPQASANTAPASSPMPIDPTPVAPRPAPQQKFTPGRMLDTASMGLPAMTAMAPAAPGPIGTNDAYQASMMAENRVPQGVSEALAGVIGGGVKPDVMIDTGAPGQATPWSGWNSVRHDAMPFTDNYMSQDPVHVLGVNGFRTGSSSPFVDNSGPRQRAMIGQQGLEMQRLIGLREQGATNNALELLRMNMISSDKRANTRERMQQNFDIALQKTPPGARIPLIDQAEKDGLIDMDVARQLRLQDTLDMSRKAGVMDPKTGRPKDIERFIGAAATALDPERMSRAEFIKALQAMGISADEIAGVAKRNPALSGFAESLLSPPSQKKAPPSVPFGFML